MSKFREIKKRLKEAKNKVTDSFLANKIQAYKNVFSGNGTKRDADIVLTDLIQTYDVDEPAYKNHLTSEQVSIRATLREPVLRIKKFIGYSDEDVRKLISNINKK